MRVIQGMSLDCHGTYHLPRLLEDVEFRRCTVESCQHPPRQDGPRDRPIFRRVQLTRCHVGVSDLPPIVADECVVDTIWFHRGIWGPQALAGCAFRRCVIRGAVTGNLIFTPGPAFGRARPLSGATNDPYYVANRQFYQRVDWALDITEARFTGVEFASGIPAHLIRRDPSRQVVLRRSALLDGRWQTEVKNTYARLCIETFLQSGFDDTILASTTRVRKYSDDVAAIDELVELGLAER